MVGVREAVRRPRSPRPRALLERSDGSVAPAAARNRLDLSPALRVRGRVPPRSRTRNRTPRPRDARGRRPHARSIGDRISRWASAGPVSEPPPRKAPRRYARGSSGGHDVTRWPSTGGARVVERRPASTRTRARARRPRRGPGSGSSCRTTEGGTCGSPGWTPSSRSSGRHGGRRRSGRGRDGTERRHGRAGGPCPRRGRERRARRVGHTAATGAIAASSARTSSARELGGSQRSPRSRAAPLERDARRAVPPTAVRGDDAVARNEKREAVLGAERSCRAGRAGRPASAASSP